MQLFEPDDGSDPSSRRRRKPASTSTTTCFPSAGEPVTVPVDLIDIHGLAALIRNEMTTTKCDQEQGSYEERRDQMNIIIDCRSFLEFNTSHILSAFNICCSKIVKRRLERNQMTVKQLLEHSVKCELLNNRISKVVVYDHLGLSLQTRDSFTWTFLEKLKLWLPGNIVQYVGEGFVGFKCNYPTLCSNPGNTGEGREGVKVSSDASLFTSSGNSSRQLGDTWKGGVEGEGEEDGPSLILPFLYLGSMKDAQDQQVLRSRGITYELNVSSSCPKSDWIQDSHFLRISVNDNHHEQLLPFFPIAFDFMDRVRLEYIKGEEEEEKGSPGSNDLSNDAATCVDGCSCSSSGRRCSSRAGMGLAEGQVAGKEKGKGTLTRTSGSVRTGGAALIHCLAGVSRSATVAIGYLMKHSHISLDDSYRYVKSRRPSISPNFNFLGQLHEYERQLQLIPGTSGLQSRKAVNESSASATTTSSSLSPSHSPSLPLEDESVT